MVSTLFLKLLLLLVLQCASRGEICEADICEYTFVISMQQSLVYKPPGGPPGFFDVELDKRGELRIVNSTFRPTEIFPEFIGQKVPDPLEVITLDGVKRNVFTINGQFPGPTIEVLEGSQLVVHIENRLHDQGVTFHWHGLPMRTSTWMDGVPQLTQCAIPTGHSFTYRFTASPAGTFWYHSHFGYQRSGGLAGHLLIHAAKPSMPYSAVFIQDWHHEEGHVYWSSHPLAQPMVAGAGGGSLWNYPAMDYTPTQVDSSDVSIIRWTSGLINGRGRFKQNEKWPLSIFQVQKGKWHLFRVTSGAGDFPLEFSIDNHQLRVVALDGMEVDPEVYDSVILYPAERADVEIIANQPVGQYWMRSKCLKDHTRYEGIDEMLAVVSYKGATQGLDPRSKPKVCSKLSPCRVLNCPFKYYPDTFHRECVHMADVKRQLSYEERVEYGLTQEYPDEEFFLNLNFNKGAAFNAQNFVPPTTPPFQTDSKSVDCSTDCPSDEVCSCTLKLNLPFNRIIQLVISNISPQNGTIQVHPVHIHGHHFAVVRQGFPDYTYPLPAFTISQTPNPDVICNDVLCRHAFWNGGVQPKLNLQDPPLKDTVVVPSSGYTVVRFRSDNPGVWIAHCHFEHHLVQGSMAFMLMEAEERFPPVPPTMPTCSYNFSLSDQEYVLYKYEAQRAVERGGVFKKISPIAPSPRSYPAWQWYHYPAYLMGETGNTMLSLGKLLGVFGFGLVGGALIALSVLAIHRRCHQQKPSGKAANNKPGSSKVAASNV